MRMSALIKWSLVISMFLMEIAGAMESMGIGAEDLQMAKIARERIYPGGRDEEDLEVQDQLTKPARKEDAKRGHQETSSTYDDEF